MIKIKIALFSENGISFSKVYTLSVLKTLGTYGELSPRIDKSNIERYKDFLKNCEIAFATWGMPQFTEEEIKKYMPCLKVVFYSAGTVQYFAKPFLDCGIRVFSAFSANGVPVAEKLKELDVSVFAYDPFVKAEKANIIGVTLCDMETIFKECDVISNHLVGTHCKNAKVVGKVEF